MIRLLIVGHGERFHVGAMFYHGAQATDIPVHLLDVRQAMDGNWLLLRINRYFRDRRPVRLRAFNQLLIETAYAERPNVLLVTGMLPPDRLALVTLRDLGIRCVNFLTDDPWNPSHKASWILDALPFYDIVFTPRYANILDLERLGCTTQYMPFAYDPSLHFREACPPELADRYACDVLFYGGADRDRLTYITALIDAGFNVHLYGGYWDRYSKTRPYWKGMADTQTLRWAAAGAKVTLCLVRRANRDGHVMRTYECAAMRTCLLAEDTLEHREILGSDGTTAVFFSEPKDMVRQASDLLDNEPRRTFLADNLYEHVTTVDNTYGARLMKLVGYVSAKFSRNGGQEDNR